MSTTDAAPTLAEEVPTTLTPEERRQKRWETTKGDFKLASVLLFVSTLGLSGALRRDWWKPTTGREDLDAVTKLIFAQNGLVAPFEILSVLLLAALIAGVVISLREPPEPGFVEPVNQQPGEPTDESAGGEA